MDHAQPFYCYTDNESKGECIILDNSVYSVIISVQKTVLTGILNRKSKDEIMFYFWIRLLTSLPFLDT